DVLQALEKAPQTPAWSIEVLSEAERSQILVRWNATGLSYPEGCIDELFEAQVARTPDAAALEQGERRLSYGQLNQAADRLAQYLRGQGVKAGARVALDLERSVELVCAQLAILKCKASYVPLDQDAPLERKAFILQDCAAGWMVTLRAHELPPVQACRIDLDGIDLDGTGAGANAIEAAGAEEEAEPGGLSGATGSNESIAYVMYTSGSTGQPKGVEIAHRGIARLVLNNGYAEFTASDRVAFAANPAFDASTMEVWGPLLNGGCAVVIDRSTVLQPRPLQQCLQGQRISVLFLSSGLFNQMARVLPQAFVSLRYLIVGGEALDPQIFAQVLRAGRPQHFLHAYGPTETTTFATTYEIEQVDEHTRSVPIG